MARFSDKRRAAVDAAMRDEVYRTSVKILTEEGMAGLTLDRIASEIGVSRPTLYNYFSDRADVVNFIADRLFEPLNELLDDIVARPIPAREKLDGVCSSVIDSIYQERALVEALFLTEMREGELRQGKADRRRNALRLISTILEEGVARGEFRPVPVSMAAELILGAIHSQLEGMIDSGHFLSADEVVPPLLDLLLVGLQAPEASGGG